MSWHYLPELAAEYSAGTCLVGNACVQSNTTSTPETCCLQDSEMDACQSFQSGTTSEPLMESLGEVWLTLYQEAFRAKTFQQPEKVPESKDREADSGRKWLELSVKYDRDTHSWKTHRCLFDEDLPQSSVTLPKWGMMQRGVLYRLRTAEHGIKGSDCGALLGTPTATMRVRSEKFRRGRTPNPAEAVMFPTPDANCGKRGASANPAATHRPSGAQKQKNLNDAVKMWPTPRANDAEKRGKIANNPRNGLPARVMYLTPCARDWKDNGKSPAELARNSETLATQAGGQLNPTWVEWLMGWPIGWTDCAALETDKFQSWQQQHGVD